MVLLARMAWLVVSSEPSIVVARTGRSKVYAVEDPWPCADRVPKVGSRSLGDGYSCVSIRHTRRPAISNSITNLFA